MWGYRRLQHPLIRKPDKSFMEIFRESTLWSMTFALLNSGSYYYGTFYVNKFPYLLEQIRM